MLCTAHRSDGAPCAANAIRGGRVCWAHGGAAPAVRAAAAGRLVEAELQKVESRVRDKNERHRMEEQARRAALQPWTGELGPRYVWEWHSPQMLRRVAAEMRRVAADLTALASTTDPGRQKACTPS